MIANSIAVRKNCDQYNEPIPFGIVHFNKNWMILLFAHSNPCTVEIWVWIWICMSVKKHPTWLIGYECKIEASMRMGVSNSYVHGKSARTKKDKIKKRLNSFATKCQLNCLHRPIQSTSLFFLPHVQLRLEFHERLCSVTNWMDFGIVSATMNAPQMMETVDPH